MDPEEEEEDEEDEESASSPKEEDHELIVDVVRSLVTLLDSLSNHGYFCMSSSMENMVVVAVVVPTMVVFCSVFVLTKKGWFVENKYASGAVLDVGSASTCIDVASTR